MGRELRMVPKDWEHPRNANGKHIPLYSGEDFKRHINANEWEVRQEDYMPNWKDEERTHFQMYETTSEGTPISPPMPTPEALAQWLVDNKASSFGSMTATYDQWLSTIKRGWAFGAVMERGKGLLSGVEATSMYSDNEDD